MIKSTIFSTTSPDAATMELMLLADPDLERIYQYLGKSELWVYQENGRVFGVIVIKIDLSNAEIMNIAVDPSKQRQGVGIALVHHVIQLCRTRSIKKLQVKTGNSSTQSIALYKKAGFSHIHTNPDFFTNNYPDPIFENGMQCKDQLVFEMML